MMIDRFPSVLQHVFLKIFLNIFFFNIYFINYNNIMVIFVFILFFYYVPNVHVLNVFASLSCVQNVPTK